MENFLRKMKLFLIILCLFSTASYAKYSEEYIFQAIENEKVFYCMEDGASKQKVVFDRYRNRLYHYPFNNFNKVKILNYERIDDENPVYRTTYITRIADKKLT
jgi:hypothetical protein